MIKTHKRTGSQVSFMYPARGKGNILRRVKGAVEEKGNGPNGPFLRVLESNGEYRTFSTKKIVDM